VKHRNRSARTQPRTAVPRPKPHRNVVGVVAAAVMLACITLIAIWLIPERRDDRALTPAAVEASGKAWRVGMLRPDGLRLVATGRADASQVLDPERFAQPDVKRGYWIATQIPSLLNQLYCWCGCEDRGEHRSSLQCFEDTMATDCPVCLGTAEIAYEMSQNGIDDPAAIQAAVDRVWGFRS
jgi:hypothetical protein